MQKATMVAVIVAGIVGIAAGLVLQPKIGATAVKHQHKSKDCTTATKCQIDITIDCTGVFFPTCEPFPDDAELALIKSTTTSLAFRIQPSNSGYTFNSAAGIQFTTDNGGNLHFTCSLGGQPDAYKCDISGAAPYTPYKYSLYVNTLPIVDPWVVNY